MNPDNVDFCARDKRNYGENTGFLLTRTLAFLASWAFAAPVALVNTLINAPKAVSVGKESKTIGGKKLSFPPVGPALVEVKPLNEREFDLVMYGATGFTGGLACKYLAKQYGKSIKWAIAGRRKDALEKVKQECIKINPDLKDLEIIQVDSSSDEQLQAMCVRSRVVITTVGPFVNYGTPLIRASIATKSNLCDITGEADWVAGLIDNYDDEARKAGSKLVSFCGHDSIPWDLSTYILAKKLKEKGEDLVEIEFIDATVSAPSGGTLESIMEYPIGGYKPKHSKFNPLRRADDGTESPFRLVNKSHLLPVYTSTKEWAGPFVMSMVNGKVVERSNALNGYGQKVVFKEHRAAESYSSVIGRYLELAAAGPILLLPPSLKHKFLPQSGEGPTEEAMENGFLQVTGMATGEKGSKIASRLYFRYDAGYRETARMLVETGLTVALTPEKCHRQSGILTPGSCCAEALFQRLLNTGTEFCFVSNL